MDALIWKISQRSRRTLNIQCCLRMLCLIILPYCSHVFSATQSNKAPNNPINVQAALIKNFTHLIEWPKNKYEAKSVFNLCIHHSIKLKRQFETIFTDKHIKGKQVDILNISNTNFSGCDLVYLTPTTTDSISSVLESTHKLGILTISAQDGYGQLGVHINFYKLGQNMAFELNKYALDRGGFQVSTQLYRYARIIQ